MRISENLGLSNKKRGFTIMELLVVMSLFSLIISVTISGFKKSDYTEKIRNEAYFAKVKGSFLKVRLKASQGEIVHSSITLTQDGSVYFTGGSNYPKLSVKDSGYFTYLEGKKLDGATILTSPNFKNLIQGASNNGFTIGIEKKGKLLGKLIFQVGTSAYREEYYDN
ncbi:MAG: type II secretion system protein [Clostridiaceae bacterium]